MPAPSDSRLIHLLSVAKSYPSGNGRPLKVVFRPTTVSLPADRRVAILAQKGEGKSVLLELLTRAQTPDEGAVIAPLRLSPLINSGALFHMQLSGIENIRFIARVYGVDAGWLTAAVDAFCGMGKLFDSPAKNLEADDRKAIEASVVTILSFDCYLFDNIGQLAPEMAERCFDAATRRHAGVIFGCSNPRRVRQFADFVVVIGNQTLHLYDHVEEAVRFYERQQG